MIIRIACVLLFVLLQSGQMNAQVVPSLDTDGAHHRWRQLNQIRRDKFDLILPAVMRENGIDMWIIMCREGNFEPIYEFLGGGYVSHNGYYIFTDRGGSRVERSVLGVDGYLLEKTGAWDYFGDESELQEFVKQRDPRRIGLNMSKDIGGADGLSHTGRVELASLLGKKYEERFVSAEKLYSDFRSRHVLSEIAAFTEAGHHSYRIAERALSNELITPGKTTLEEVAWWMMEQLHRLNLETSFGMPSVYVTGPDGILATSTDRIIRRGDILMIDWGVGYLGYYTDMKRMAYVLKEGEMELPQGIANAFAQALKSRQVIMETIKPGMTAQQAMDEIYRALERAGFVRMKEFNKPGQSEKTDVMIGCHSVADWGHGTGPSIAHFNPVQLTYKLVPTNLLSIELFAYTPLPEWGGKKLRIPLEDDAVVAENGMQWLYPVNERVLLVR